ncbi:MAG: radical SAM protein [Fibrobacteres bacterium]|nr:radical SAM protein [Fibrobacterota bacterium]
MVRLNERFEIGINMLRIIPVKKYLKVAKSLIANRIAGESVYPVYASFKLTRRCHFSCKFCNIKDNSAVDMSTEKVKQILDNLSKSSVVLVSFEGGEPLLRPDIRELLQYARSKNFYLLFTTSERKLERYPMKEFAEYIDFLHISIDEGHGNLEMLDRLKEYASYGTRLSIQIVVEKETLGALENKVKLCYEAGANVVIMPAVQMDRTDNHFPDLEMFETEMKRLKRLYPYTTYTPDGYFNAVRKGICSTASVVIGADGYLSYPCHIRDEKGPDLSQVDLMDWLKGEEAKSARERMKNCGRNCGWFQYFSISDFVTPAKVIDALRPLFKKHQSPK